MILLATLSPVLLFCACHTVPNAPLPSMCPMPKAELTSRGTRGLGGEDDGVAAAAAAWAAPGVLCRSCPAASSGGRGVHSQERLPSLLRVRSMPSLPSLPSLPAPVPAAAAAPAPAPAPAAPAPAAPAPAAPAPAPAPNASSSGLGVLRLSVVRDLSLRVVGSSPSRLVTPSRLLARLHTGWAGAG